MRCSCLENGKYLTILIIQTNLYDLNNTKKYFLAHTMMFAIMIIGGTGKTSQMPVRDILYCTYTRLGQFVSKM